MPGRPTALVRHLARHAAVVAGVATNAFAGACGHLPLPHHTIPYPLARPDPALLRAAGPDSFTAAGQVVRGKSRVVDSLYEGYGEGGRRQSVPNQQTIGREGDTYLIREFPKPDPIITARILKEWRQ